MNSYLVFAIFITGIVVAVITIRGNRRLARAKQDQFEALPAAEQEAHLNAVAERQRVEADKAAQTRHLARETYLHGPINTAMLCPHCSARGRIRTKEVVNKRGVSGGKATAALLTGGISLLATGLSRKEEGTEAHCECCTSTWTF